ncbi:MAG: Mov34/MPN/PAD-1 family protein [Nannocystaceae bacterium]
MLEIFPSFLPRPALLRIYAHAREVFPWECCGYIRGSGDAAIVFRCTNQQEEMHAIDPTRFPRTAASAYQIGGIELLDLARSFDGPLPASVIYHSHPAVGAYFSVEDARAADAARYPVRYLVIDAQPDRIAESRLYSANRHDGRATEYNEVARYRGAEI